MLVVEINRAATFKTCPILGFNPDYLMDEPTSADAQTRAEFDGRVDDLCAFYRYYYKRAWTKQPDRMAGKIAREMLAFYGPYCPAYYRWKTRHLSREYSQSLIAIQAADLRRQWAPYKLLENLIHRTTLNSHKTDLAFQYLVFSGVVSCFWHALTRWLLAYPQQRS